MKRITSSPHDVSIPFVPSKTSRVQVKGHPQSSVSKSNRPKSCSLASSATKSPHLSGWQSASGQGDRTCSLAAMQAEARFSRKVDWRYAMRDPHSESRTRWVQVGHPQSSPTSGREGRGGAGWGQRIGWHSVSVQGDDGSSLAVAQAASMDNLYRATSMKMRSAQLNPLRLRFRRTDEVQLREHPQSPTSGGGSSPVGSFRRVSCRWREEAKRYDDEATRYDK